MSGGGTLALSAGESGPWDLNKRSHWTEIDGHFWPAHAHGSLDNAAEPAEIELKTFFSGLLPSGHRRCSS